MTTLTLPELPKLIVNGSGAYKYVFTYKNRWDRKTKSSTRGKGDTQSVGKFVLDPNTDGYGEILFSEEFKEKFPALEHMRVFRHKGGKLEFKPKKEESPQRVRTGEIVKLHGGATWALNHIIGTTPLARALRETFPEYKSYLRILSLVYFLVINRDSSLCNYEEFAECTWLPYGRGMTSGSVSRLLSKIDKRKISRFLKKLNEEYIKEHGEGLAERRYWALDSTSVTSYSENIASVAYGHNKDLIAAPQTNVLAIVDQKTGVPVYYRNFDGNVPDVSTVRNTLAELAMIKIDTDNVVLVTDKGYGSASNFEDMLRNKVSFISNVRRNLNRTITELIDSRYAELLDWNHGLGYLRENAVTVPIQWQYDDYPVRGKRKQSNAHATLYVHLYYSKSVNDEMTLRLQAALQTALVQKKTSPETLSDGQKRLLETYTKQRNGETVISMRKVDATLRYAGVRVLISDTVSDAKECAVAYEERNQVEYAFNTLKARLECNRTGVHSTQNWEGKLFIQMLAVALSGMVRTRVKLYNEQADRDKKSYRVYYDSDHKLLAKLNNIYLTRFEHGFLFDEIAGKKKELFKILDVPVPTVEQVVRQNVPDDDPIQGEEDPFVGSLAGSDRTEDL